MFYLIIFAYLLVNLWIVLWFWRGLKGNTGLRVAVCLLLLTLAVAYPLLFFGSGTSLAELFLLRAGAIWAGTFIYTFFLVVLFDLLRLLVPWLRVRDQAPRYASALVVAVATVAIAMAGWINAARPVLREVVISDADLPRNVASAPGKRELVVAVLSDVHLGRMITPERFDRMIDLIADKDPDLVLFAGDILDDHLLIDADAVKKSLDRIRPPMGIWACLGNHEYHSGPIAVSMDYLRRFGIRTLVDEYAVINNSLVLVGRDDYSRNRMGGGRKNLGDILMTLPQTRRSLPIIVMDHQPQQLADARGFGAVLQVSGHTHYGQIWPVNYIVKGIYENAYGHTRRGRTHYVVSCGAGTWGPPVRNTSRPEVLLVRMNIR